MGLAMHFGFPRHILRVLFGSFAAAAKGAITAILPGSKWSVLFFFLRIGMQDAMGEVWQVHPQPILKVFVDDRKSSCLGTCGSSANSAEGGKQTFKA